MKLTKWAVVVLIAIVFWGFVLPALFSAPSDIAVIAGVLLLVTPLLIALRLIERRLNKGNEQ